jgi:hypothetical protein
MKNFSGDRLNDNKKEENPSYRRSKPLRIIQKVAMQSIDEPSTDQPTTSAQSPGNYAVELARDWANFLFGRASDPPRHGNDENKDTPHNQEHIRDASPQYQYGIPSSSSHDSTAKFHDALEIQHDITQYEREAFSFCKHIARTTAIDKSAIHAYLEILNSERQFAQNHRFKTIYKFSHDIIKNTNMGQKELFNTLDTLRKINQNFSEFAMNNHDLFSPDSQQALADKLNTWAKNSNRKSKFNEYWLKELTNTLLTLRQIAQGLRKFAKGNPELFRPALQQELANTRELNTWAKNFKRKLDSNEDWGKETMKQLGIEEEYFNKIYQDFLDNPHASYSIKNASYSPGDLARQYKSNDILVGYDQLLLANAKFKPIYELLKEVFPMEGIPDRSRVSDPPRYGSYENTEAYHTSPQHRNISSQYGTASSIPSHASTSKSTDHPEIKHNTTQHKRTDLKEPFSNFAVEDLKESFTQGVKTAKELFEWTETFTKRFDLREKWVQDGIEKLGIELKDFSESYQQLQESLIGSSPQSDEQLVTASTMLKSIHELLKDGIPVTGIPDRICNRKVTQVSGEGNDCLIRALLKGAHPNWNNDLIETAVNDMRPHLLLRGVKQGAMLDLGNDEGKHLIDDMKTRGWIEPDRDILVYQYRNNKIQCFSITDEKSDKPPYAVLRSHGGEHYNAIEVPNEP